MIGAPAWLLLLLLGSADAGLLRCRAAEELAMLRNRDLIAARLQVQQAMVEQLAARMFQNPEVAYGLGNVILGRGNPQEQDLRPRPFEQLQHTVSLSQSLDVVGKRALRRRAAHCGVLASRLRVEEAWRQVRHSVRTAFAEVLREQEELRLASDMRRRYDNTVALSQKRLQAGEISVAEHDKIILEKLKYVNDEIDAQTELQTSRQSLAGLLAYPSAQALPDSLQDEAPQPQSRDTAALFALALQARADLQALQLEHQQAATGLRVARRDAVAQPQLGLAYTRSYFQASGDNPHALGLQLAVPLPLFARNQDGIRAAEVAVLTLDNALEARRLQIAADVRQAVAQVARARAMLDIFETDMLRRADGALGVAEKSYRAGATR